MPVSHSARRHGQQRPEIAWPECAVRRQEDGVNKRDAHHRFQENKEIVSETGETLLCMEESPGDEGGVWDRQGPGGVAADRHRFRAGAQALRRSDVSVRSSQEKSHRKVRGKSAWRCHGEPMTNEQSVAAGSDTPGPWSRRHMPGAKKRLSLTPAADCPTARARITLGSLVRSIVAPREAVSGRSPPNACGANSMSPRGHTASLVGRGSGVECIAVRENRRDVCWRKRDAPVLRQRFRSAIDWAIRQRGQPGARRAREARSAGDPRFREDAPRGRADDCPPLHVTAPGFRLA